MARFRQTGEGTVTVAFFGTQGCWSAEPAVPARVTTHGRAARRRGRRSRAVPSAGGSLPAPLPLSPDSSSRNRPHRPHQTHSYRHPPTCTPPRGRAHVAVAAASGRSAGRIYTQQSARATHDHFTQSVTAYEDVKGQRCGLGSSDFPHSEKIISRHGRCQSGSLDAPKGHEMKRIVTCCCVGKILCVAEIVNPAAYSMIAFALFAKKKVIKFYVERKLKGT